MVRHPDELHRDTAVLVVVDVQERLHPVMASPGYLTRIELLVTAAHRLGLPLLVTEQYPKGLGPTVPALAALTRVAPLAKDSFSCIGEPEFRRALAATGRSQVVVTGIEAHVCVCQTALDLLAEGRSVHVPHDAVSSRRPGDRDRALDRLSRAGVVVTSTESALFELLERAGTDDFRALSKALKQVPLE